MIAFTGLEAAASVAGEVSATRREIKSLVGSGSALIVLVYVGIAIVGVGVLPVHNGLTELGTSHIDAPLVGVVEAFHPQWVADVLKYAVAIGGAVGLTAAAGWSMLGVSRVGYGLATNRQIPSAIGRLHPTFGTPFVVIAFAALGAAALVIPRDLELLVGIFAFGALLAFTIAHVSVIALRYREADRPRAYEVPLSVTIRGGRVPIPAVLGALLAAAGWVTVLVFHSGARYVGAGWLLGGLVLYVIYRKSEQKPLLRRVTIPERALHHEALEPEFGSILVPIFGSPLDDDIVQTAGRLAGETHDDLEEEGAVIEAIWVFEVPLAVPLDAPLSDAQVAPRARGAGASQAGRRGVRGGRGGHGDRSRAAHRRGDRQRGPAPGGRGDRARRRGALPGARRLAAGRCRRSAGQLRRGGHEIRRQQGSVPGYPHGSACRLALQHRRTSDTRWLNAIPLACNGCWAPTPCLRPPTATSAPRSTTRWAWWRRSRSG